MDTDPLKIVHVLPERMGQGVQLESEAHEGPILEGEVREERAALACVTNVGDAEDVKLTINFHLLGLLVFLLGLLGLLLFDLALFWLLCLVLLLFTILLFSLFFLGPLLFLGRLEFFGLCSGPLLLLPQGSASPAPSTRFASIATFATAAAIGSNAD